MDCNLKKLVKSFVPDALWMKLGIMRRKWHARNDVHLTPREVFSRIYENGIWSTIDEADRFCSGTGSRMESVVAPYADAVKGWMSEHGDSEWTALDVGCGDFNVGGRVCGLFRRYMAVDVVPALIEMLKSNGPANVEFGCIDAIDQPLPSADVIFIRQVLQHLSNAQISQMVPKIRKFKHAVITEHLAYEVGPDSWNLDKVHGGDVRVSRGSGVDLEKAPFEIKPSAARILLEVPAGDSRKEGLIRTTWYRFD
ncbi:MAG TPA: class I SAM-dependent methyltransferase [Luteolibacter sp.]